MAVARTLRANTATPPRLSRRRHALSVVEMALVLPMLVLVTFAVIEYAWMFLNQHQVTNAAREAARLASLPNATTSQVNSQISTLMTQYNLGSSGYTKTLTPSDVSTATRGQLVSVQISVPYSNIELTGFTLLPLPTNLNAKVSIEKEGP
jgi:Flp pilus assembly protein TadG